MALHNLRLSSIVYDDVANTLALTLLGDMPDDRPEQARDDLWYPAPSTFNVVVPVRKGTISQPSGVYTDPDTAQRYRVEYVNGTWGSPVAVDERGRQKGK